MDDIQKIVQAQLDAIKDSKAAKRTDRQLAVIDERTNNPEYAENVRQWTKKGQTDEWRKNIAKANKKKYQNPDFKKKIVTALEQARQNPEFQENHKKAIREHQAIPKELVVKIFKEFFNPLREVDNVIYKRVLSETYGISVGHLNKICMARSSYIKECLEMSDSEIEAIKKNYFDNLPKYTVRTFGVDILDLYEDYSYRSKYPVRLVWEFRFGKYKGYNKSDLEKLLGTNLTRYDVESLQKSYSWLTNKPSKLLYQGHREGACKFGPTPTKQQGKGFIKTGKNQGCIITIN